MNILCKSQYQWKTIFPMFQGFVFALFLYNWQMLARFMMFNSEPAAKDFEKYYEHFFMIFYVISSFRRKNHFFHLWDMWICIIFVQMAKDCEICDVLQRAWRFWKIMMMKILGFHEIYVISSFRRKIISFICEICDVLLKKSRVVENIEDFSFSWNAV